MKTDRQRLFERALAGDAGAMREWTQGLWEGTGGDPTVCEFCGNRLTDDQPWQRGMDGAGAHNSCLTLVQDQQRDDE